MRIFVKLVFMFILFSTSVAYADGVLFSKKQYTVLEPNQRAIIIHDGDDESIIIQVSFSGEVDQLGWVLPLPSYPEVEQCDPEIFVEIKKLTPPHYRGGGGTDSARYSDESRIKEHVQVDTQIIGIYEVNRIRADDSLALYEWLNLHRFHMPSRAQTVLDEYIQKEFSFIAVRVAPETLNDMEKNHLLTDGWLDPLKIKFKSDNVLYPMKLSSLNEGGTHLSLWIIADHRMKCKEGILVWANWIDPEILVASECFFLSDQISKQRFLSRIECEWLDNKLISDDIYLTREFVDLAVPKQYWDSEKKEYVRYGYTFRTKIDNSN